MDDDGGDWITARYLLSSILGRNPLVVADYVDEESFPVSDDDPPSPSSSSCGARRAEPPPPVRAPAGVAGTVCAVCTEEIAAADAVSRLPCAHWYHHACIQPWLGIRPTCPMCRAELPPPTGPDDDDDDDAAGRAKPARTRGVAAPAAGTSAGATAAARVRREASYEYLAVAGGVLSG